MNPYDHEDAFKYANRCAGQKTKMAEALKVCPDRETARVLIAELQQRYQDLFDAFIEGVAHGRANPLKKEGSSVT